MGVGRVDLLGGWGVELVHGALGQVAAVGDLPVVVDLAEHGADEPDLIAVNRLVSDPRSKAYVKTRTGGTKADLDTLRRLKRYTAR